MTAYVKGARVMHSMHPGRLGTVVGDGPEEGTSRVDWDAIYGETIELDGSLMPDAPMPAPEYALAKALRYRRQRDRALEDLATLVGIESNAAIERERYERQLEDARFEYEAQLANVSKVLQRTRDELAATDLALDSAETRLRNLATDAQAHLDWEGSPVEIRTRGGSWRDLTDYLGVAEVDAPTE